MKLLIAVVLLAPTMLAAEPLDLICHGAASKMESSTTFGSMTANNGYTAEGTATTMHRERSDEFLRLHIDEGGSTGKIKVPQTIIPPISRGKEGWWNLTQLSTTDDAIRGQFSMNPLNHPKVVIDRHTGDIDLKGLNMKFNGNCERATEAPDSKKF